MRACPTALILLVLLRAGAQAEDAAKSPEEWVAAIKAQAAAERLDARAAAVRLGAGVCITHYYRNETDSRKYPFPEACAALQAFLRERGEAILPAVRDGRELPAEDAPYRLPVLAVYLWAGFRETSRQKQERFCTLPLDDAGRQAARAFHERVEREGQAALLKGHTAGRLTAADVEAIRLFRIAQGMRGVGECFLPSRLGFHPYAPSGRASYDGHGVQSVINASFGKPQAGRHPDRQLPARDGHGVLKAGLIGTLARISHKEGLKPGRFSALNPYGVKTLD